MNSIDRQEIVDSEKQHNKMSFVKQALSVIALGALIASCGIHYVKKNRLGKFSYDNVSSYNDNHYYNHHFNISNNIDAFHQCEHIETLNLLRRENVLHIKWEGKEMDECDMMMIEYVKEKRPTVYNDLKTLDSWVEQFFMRDNFKQALKTLGSEDVDRIHDLFIERLNIAQGDVMIGLLDSVSYKSRLCLKQEKEKFEVGRYSYKDGSIFAEYVPGWNYVLLHEKIHKIDLGVALPLNEPEILTDLILAKKRFLLDGTKYHKSERHYLRSNVDEITPRVISIIHFYSSNVCVDIDGWDVSIESLKSMAGDENIYKDAKMLLQVADLHQLADLIHILVHGVHKYDGMKEIG